MDWDDEYANSAYVEGSDLLPELWATRALAYRQSGVRIEPDIAYGDGPRQRLDLIRPDGPCLGLVVLVHGGYWLSYGKSDWTDLAEGARAQGWAVALPEYTIAPQAGLPQMTDEIGAAITKAAALVEGPIRLTGHSAGGHLVTRMLCDDTPLPPDILARIEKVVTVSGLHDLRLLPHTRMNDTLSLTPEVAAAESSALHLPVPDAWLTCWVGGDERPEFLRQSRLMALIWDGPARTSLVEDPGHNHFSVIDGLKDPSSPLTAELLAAKDALPRPVTTGDPQ